VSRAVMNRWECSPQTRNDPWDQFRWSTNIRIPIGP